ncbi:MAG: hypothetical protein WCP58_10215 [bacterium]
MVVFGGISGFILHHLEMVVQTEDLSSFSFGDNGDAAIRQPNRFPIVTKPKGQFSGSLPVVL